MTPGAAATAVSAASATALPPSTPPPTSGPATPTAAAGRNKRGVHLLLDDGASRWPQEVWQDHLEWAARLVGPGGHVVELIRSNDLRPEVWQPFFDLTAREGLVPIIRVATYKGPTDQWWVAPEPDPGSDTYRGEADRFRRFLDQIVWRTGQVIVTIGNEPNRPDEWSGAPDPAAYARYLRDMAAALRRVSAVRVIVLNAGLDGFAPSTPGPSSPDQLGGSIDAERFIEGMAAAVPEIFELLDGWASHAYPIGPFSEHPSHQELKIDDVRPEAGPRPTPPFGIRNRGVNGYAWELWKLQQLGLARDLPVYVTESGWRHRRSQAPRSADAAYATVEDERFGEYVSLAFDGPATLPPGLAAAPQVAPAALAALGWTPWNLDPRVVSVSLFALGGKPERWGHTNLVLLDPNGRILTAYPFAERLAAVQPGPFAPTNRAETGTR